MGPVNADDIRAANALLNAGKQGRPLRRLTHWLDGMQREIDRVRAMGDAGMIPLLPLWERALTATREYIATL